MLIWVSVRQHAQWTSPPAQIPHLLLLSFLCRNKGANFGWRVQTQSNMCVVAGVNGDNFSNGKSFFNVRGWEKGVVFCWNIDYTFRLESVPWTKEHCVNFVDTQQKGHLSTFGCDVRRACNLLLRLLSIPTDPLRPKQHKLYSFWCLSSCKDIALGTKKIWVRPIWVDLRGRLVLWRVARAPRCFDSPPPRISSRSSFSWSDRK